MGLRIGGFARGEVLQHLPKRTIINLGNERFGLLRKDDPAVARLIVGGRVAVSVERKHRKILYPEIYDLKALPDEVLTLESEGVTLSEGLNINNEGSEPIFYFEKLEIPKRLMGGSYFDLGQKVHFIRTGYSNPASGREICCTENFIPQAVRILEAIKTGEELTAVRVKKMGKVDADGFRILGFLSSDGIMAVRKIKGWLSGLYKMALEGEEPIKFKITAEGFREEWGVSDLLRSMAEKPLLAIETDGLEELRQKEGIPDPRWVKFLEIVPSDDLLSGNQFFIGEPRKEEGVSCDRIVSRRSIDRINIDRSIWAINTGITHPAHNLPIYCSADFILVARQLLDAIKTERRIRARFGHRLLDEGKENARHYVSVKSKNPLIRGYRPKIFWKEIKNNGNELRNLYYLPALEFVLNTNGMDYDPATGVWGFIKAMATHPLAGEVVVLLVSS